MINDSTSAMWEQAAVVLGLASTMLLHRGGLQNQLTWNLNLLEG